MDSEKMYSSNYHAKNSQNIDLDTKLFLNWMDYIEKHVYNEKHIYLSQVPMHIEYRLAFEDGFTSKIVVDYILKVS